RLQPLTAILGMPRPPVRMAAATGSALLLLRCLEIVVVGYIGNADDQNPHLATGTMDDAGRDVYQTTLRHGLLHAVEDDAAAAIENVVKLGGTLVVVELGAVDVHGVGPGRGGQSRVLVTDEAVAPAASTSLAGSVPLVPDQQRACIGGTH